MRTTEKDNRSILTGFISTPNLHQDKSHILKNIYSLTSKNNRHKFLVKGFTLLELMIALSIFILIWGGSGHLFVQMSRLIKNILHQKESSLALDMTRWFEKDVYTQLKKVEGDSEKISFNTPLGEAIYELNGKSVYRKVLEDEQLVLKNAQDCRWKFLSKGQWFENWNQDALPDAILWEFQIDDEFFRMIYPMRFEK